MNPTRRFAVLAGAFAALALSVGEARAVFLVQVTSTLNAPAGTVTSGQSSDTVAVFTDQPSDVDLSTGAFNPVHQIFGTNNVISTNTTGSDAFDFGYDWQLVFKHIVDGVATGDAGSFGVTGQLVGNVSTTGSTINNTYKTGPVNSTADLLIDGRHVFIQLDPFTPNGTPGVGAPGDTQKSFSVSMFNVPVPEPTTFALMGVGGLLMAAPYLRKKARKAA